MEALEDLVFSIINYYCIIPLTLSTFFTLSANLVFSFISIFSYTEIKWLAESNSSIKYSAQGNVSSIYLSSPYFLDKKLCSPVWLIKFCISNLNILAKRLGVNISSSIFSLIVLVVTMLFSSIRSSTLCSISSISTIPPDCCDWPIIENCNAIENNSFFWLSVFSSIFFF